MTKMNTGALSHDKDYRAKSVIPKGGKFISWKDEPGYMVVVYSYRGEKIRTKIQCKPTQRTIYR